MARSTHTVTSKNTGWQKLSDNRGVVIVVTPPAIGNPIWFDSVSTGATKVPFYGREWDEFENRADRAIYMNAPVGTVVYFDDGE